MFGKDKGVKNIKPEILTKTVEVSGKTVNVHITALSGEVEGKREILDEVLIDDFTSQLGGLLKRTTSRYFPLPDNISFGKVVAAETISEAPKPEPEAQIIESTEPRFELSQVALNDKVREQINTAISAVKYKKIMTDEWGMSEHFTDSRAVILNFYGKAGTGKSMAAEAIAKALGKRVYRINYSELESKYVGETPKNIRRAFENATRDNAVLIFDEADSFLGKRLTSVTQSADYGVNITRSVLLMELEKFSGIVVFTTNLIKNYDEAFKRRILLSVYFEMPDEQARTAIWKLHLGGKMPLAADVTAEELAKRYDNVSGADIKDMVFYAALRALEQEKKEVGFSEFDYSHETIKERYENRDEEQGFKIVSSETITEEEYKKEVSGNGNGT